MTENKETGLALMNADRTLAIADDLQKIVKEKKLTANIQGKDYALVEAWQFAGSRLGVIAISHDPVKIEGDSGNPEKNIRPEIKYGCSADLKRMDTGEIVGHSYMVCSNREPNKRTFEEYAICSMAQTRAIGKAYRLLCGWLMKAAGFEATPAEEMDTVPTGNKKTGEQLGDEIAGGLDKITETEATAIRTALETIDEPPDFPAFCKHLGIARIEDLTQSLLPQARKVVTVLRREAKVSKEGK